MSILELKNLVQKNIETIEDEKFLEDLYILTENQKENTSSKPLTEISKLAIERGLADAEAGRKRSFEEVMKKYQKYQFNLQTS